MKNTIFSQNKKNAIKIIRSIIQGIIIVFLGWLLITNFFYFEKHEANSQDLYTEEEGGFIALSYFGVDRMGTQTLIDKQRLRKHLEALKAQGYVTISQQDVLAYYQENKALPPKSLFLIFEDGRRDTVIFAEEILKDLNNQATIMSYASNLELKDPKFLTPKDLLEIKRSNYWEFGSNGYRLAFINVFDRHGHFLGELDTNEFQRLSPYLQRRYNHYLMDYIRDEYSIPTENLEEMQDRIAYDYEGMARVYTEQLEQIPELYILMHSNTGQFGSNEKVSLENEKWIHSTFKMNFNREGYALNTRESSIYDLTRMQPQAYWPTNHLLMRVREDTKEEITFVEGNLERKAYFEQLEGASEFVGSSIILTSLPRGKGLLKLRGSETYKDVQISLELQGRKKGEQGIYLRADENIQNYIYFQLKDDQVTLYEKVENFPEREIFSIDLHTFDEVVPKSWEEDKKDAQVEAIKTELIYVEQAEKAKALTMQLNEKSRQEVVSVPEGGKPYTPEITLTEPQNRKVEITLKQDLLTVWLDGKPVVEEIRLLREEEGALYLNATFSGSGYSQRNLYDDVYDGIFKDLVIYQMPLNEGEEKSVLYDHRLSRMDKIKEVIKSAADEIIDWFVKNL